MTMNDSFDGRLSAWLRDTSERRVPDHLDEVLVATAAYRQRRWWSSPERWLPVTTTALSGRLAAPRPVVYFLVIAALLLGLVGVAIYAGAFRPQIPTYSGLAGNGRIVAIDSSGALMSYAADGGDARKLATFAPGTSGLSMSPDGTRIAYKRLSPEIAIEIRRLSDQAAVQIRPPVVEFQDEPVSWSPDGRLITFADYAFSGDRLIVAATDGSSIKDVTPASLVGQAVWHPTFSPDGSQISFAAYPQGGSDAAATLYVMRPDGTGLRTLKTLPVSANAAGGPDWAPDPTVQLIAYDTLIGDTLYLHVLDMATGLDHNVGPGFWPSWSPDGSQIATCCVNVSTTSEILEDLQHTRIKFAPFGAGCREYTGGPGRSICSRAIWSPDGTELMAIDITGGGLLVTPADGFGGDIQRIPLDIELGKPSGPFAWQPIWP